ncbi:hypothetical protein O181_080357 [Austropuccinia psidii MF-1]|uniref:Integrase catalytic domain-containing protein n=1 Tax=Austropuccinia psidii MF-1 TaxID=1389203 RepID=A0A9Q3IHC9_9BASI|nr:hypothetical protein [Austropuccinia psidii MF-1]
MGPITPKSILKSKEDAKHQLSKVIKQAETALEKQVKRIICNGGKDFVNSLMKDFCDTRGIRLTVTTLYTPQHNVIAERINRTLMEKARTLMIDSGVPKEHWAKLINTANFLRVRVAEDVRSRDFRFNEDEIPIKIQDNVITKPIEAENTSEEEIRPVRKETVDTEQSVPMQEDRREPI